jgi:alkylhydroperoxidase family enzyme
VDTSDEGRHPDGDQARSGPGFLPEPEHTAEAQRLFDEDLAGLGYVMNTSRLWAYLPATLDGLSDLLGQVTSAGSLSFRQRAVLVTAAASTLGDSYCSLAWGTKLAGVAGAGVAEAVVRGEDDGLDPSERALARWARLVATDPNAITAGDVESLREAGFDEEQIFAITTFVALRLAFSTVNDALGACPDRQLGAATPELVRAAVSFGRPVDGGPADAT